MGKVLHLIMVILSMNSTLLSQRRQQFNIFHGFKLGKVENAKVALTKSTQNVATEVQCLNPCVDSADCSAVAYNMGTHDCVENYYGRVILEVDPASDVWVKSMLLVSCIGIRQRCCQDFFRRATATKTISRKPRNGLYVDSPILGRELESIILK